MAAVGRSPSGLDGAAIGRRFVARTLPEAGPFVINERPGSFGPANHRLLFPAQLAKVLGLKCELRRNLVRAYRAKNKKRLKLLAAGDLKTLRVEVDQLWKCHRTMWLEAYKPFGWEAIEERYGGLRARLQSLSERLHQYQKGDVDSIPEFETKPEKIFQTAAGNLPRATYSRVATASAARW